MVLKDSVGTSETSVYFYETARRNIFEACYLCIRRRKNLISLSCYVAQKLIKTDFAGKFLA
jgi:hypothetical protein